MADVVAFLRRLRIRHNNIGLRRTLRDRLDPFTLYNDEELFQRFRFRRATIIYIVHLIGNGIARATRRSQALPPVIQTLLFLRFIATGGFYQLIGDSLNISKAATGRCIRAISKILINKAPDFVKFPVGAECGIIKKAFHAIAGFPNVIGLIDGTQVKIQKPQHNEADFVNRKGFHSINVQAVCDNKFKITNCVAKWPGSCHDSRIFRECGLSREFKNGTHQGFLLGDSGYPCKSYLLTPFLKTDNIHSRERYNQAHGS